MKDFAAASFSPETVELMTSALKSAVETLPEPISSRLIHRLAETILRVARDGERNPTVMRRMALLELQISVS